MAEERSAGASSPRLVLTARLRDGASLTAAGMALARIDPAAPSPVSFVMSRMEFQLSRAALAPRLGGAMPHTIRPALPMAVSADFPLPFAPPPSVSATFVLDAPLLPRQRLRSTGARQYLPVVSGFRPWGEIEEIVAAVDSPAAFAETCFLFAAPAVEFECSAGRTATRLHGVTGCRARSLFPSAAGGRARCRQEHSPVSRFLQRLPGPASYERAPVLPPAGSVGEEVAPSDSGSVSASGFEDFRAGSVILPHFSASETESPDADADLATGPRAAYFDGAETAAAFRVLNGANGGINGYPGVLIDPSPILYCENAVAMPLAKAAAGSPIAEPALFQFPRRLPNVNFAPDLGEFDLRQTTRPPAGFVKEAPPAPSPEVCQYLHDSADFSLYPVWLPALFTLSGPRSGFRATRAFNPCTLAPPSFVDQSLCAPGPGFSGMLRLPLSGDVVRDFTERTPAMTDSATPDSLLPPPAAAASPLQSALDLWRNVPVLARGLALGIPLLTGALLFGPSMATPANSVEWSKVAAKIHDRATVDLSEDFQSGLAAWTGNPGWESSWSHPPDGSAQPGRLALYRPTLALRNYQFEFQSYIESKALGFVFRAADVDNYYAAKFVVKKSGPLPSMALVRYAVIGGRVTSKTERPIPLYLQEDTQYNTLVTVEGEHFTININGQLVDAWSDSRLKSGGVGVFADKGEVAHYRAVQVVDRKDFLGWACSQVSTWTADRRTVGVNHE